jgi:hypothetical protein
VLNGTIFTVGEAASNPGLVLTLLVRQLGGSLTLISLLPVIQSTGYLLPQIIVGGHVQALPYKLPTYRLFALLRLIAQLALIVACYIAGMVDPRIGTHSNSSELCVVLYRWRGHHTQLPRRRSRNLQPQSTRTFSGYANCREDYWHLQWAVHLYVGY